jgi:hypothetical protein
MSTMQSRRRFLTTLSLAGAAGLLRAPPALAAEGPLDGASLFPSYQVIDFQRLLCLVRRNVAM